MIQNKFYYVSQSEFWTYFLKYHYKDSLFKGCQNDLRKQVFRDMVTIINFETSSFCNRKCVYCPVSVFGTRDQRYMSDRIFEKIISELKEIDYRGIIGMSLFNEPFAGDNIFDRIKAVKNALPKCYVTLNSNGDYFNRDMLNKLSESGASEALITLHMAPGEKYSDELAKKKLEVFFEKLGLPYNISEEQEGHSISCNLNYEGLVLFVGTRNWESDGCDRGGSVEALSISKREMPCASPFREIALDIEGNFRMCCNMYVNTKPLANIMEKGFLDYYFSDELNKIRKNLVKWGDGKIQPCDSCNSYMRNIYTKEEWSEFYKKLQL